MEVKKRLMKSLEGTSHLLLMFLSLAWAYFFYLIWKNNGIFCDEPNRIWLICEFFLSLSVSGIGFIAFIRFLKIMKKN